MSMQPGSDQSSAPTPWSNSPNAGPTAEGFTPVVPRQPSRRGMISLILGLSVIAVGSIALVAMFLIPDGLSLFAGDLIWVAIVLSVLLAATSIAGIIVGIAALRQRDRRRGAAVGGIVTSGCGCIVFALLPLVPLILVLGLLLLWPISVALGS